MSFQVCTGATLTCRFGTIPSRLQASVGRQSFADIVHF